MADWYTQAACRGQGPDAFVQGGRAYYEDARELCRTCPVRHECLDYALADHTLMGLWGGSTDAERRAMRRRHEVA